jgi:hypothetical protein
MQFQFCYRPPNKHLSTHEQKDMSQQTATSGALSPDEIESLVRDWFRTYSEKDFDAHNALIHPKAVVVYPGH